MCSSHTKLSSNKAMGSKWSVLLLAIVTLIFGNPALADWQVQMGNFNASEEICPLNQHDPDLVRVYPGGGRHQNPDLHSIFPLGTPSRGLREQGGQGGPSISPTIDPGNLSFATNRPDNLISDSHISSIVTTSVGLFLVLIYGSFSLTESNKIVRLLKKKVVALNCSLWKMTFAYNCLVEDFDLLRQAYDEAQITISSLESKLVAKTQAVSEVEGLLNDSMLMAMDEAAKMKQCEANAEIKYRQAKDALKTSNSKSAQLIEILDSADSCVSKLHQKIKKLEEEMAQHKDLLPFEGKKGGGFEDLAGKSLADDDQLQEQPVVSNNSSSPPIHDRLIVGPKECLNDKDLVVAKVSPVQQRRSQSRFIEDISIQPSEFMQVLEVLKIDDSVPELSTDCSTPTIVLPKKKKNLFKRAWSKFFSRKAKKSTLEPKTLDAELKGSSRSEYREGVGPRPP